jgi:hypothetical protein
MKKRKNIMKFAVKKTVNQKYKFVKDLLNNWACCTVFREYEVVEALNQIFGEDFAYYFKEKDELYGAHGWTGTNALYLVDSLEYSRKREQYLFEKELEACKNN